jgi:hypothetical protein
MMTSAAVTVTLFQQAQDSGTSQQRQEPGQLLRSSRMTNPASTTCEIQRWMTIPRAQLRPFERWATTPHAPKTDVLNDDVCDVFRWDVISLDDAIRTKGRKRCVECKQEVKPSSAGGSVHFAHVTRNPTCSLSGPRRA